ncbi:MAG: hypothetical protein AAGN35_21445 [Bacteroidota bacterium]
MIRIWLVAVLLCAGFTPRSQAQDFSVDMRIVVGGNYTLIGSDLNESGECSAVGEFSLNEAGSCTLGLSAGAHAICTVRFDVDASGAISRVEWQAAAPLVGGFAALGGSWYTLEAENTRLVLQGQSFGFGSGDSDLAGLALAGVEPVEGQSQQFRAFPGFYVLSCAAGEAALGMGYLPGDSLAPRVFLSDSGEVSPGWTELHPDFYERTTGSVTLRGKSVKLDFTALEGQDFRLQGMREGIGQITAGNSGAAKLLPGRYSARLTDSGASEIGTLRFRVLNRTGQLSPDLAWKADTASTYGGVAQGHYFMERLGMTAALPLPDPIDVDPPGPYVGLQDQLDAGYGLMRGGELWFRYDERYATAANLEFRILDGRYQEVSLPASVSRNYGANWVQLDLSSAGLSNGDFYTLEVFGPKGDVGRLRFKVQP